jgi:hypothetical protein
MISIIDLDVEDLEVIAVAIKMSNRRSTATRDLGAVGDGAAGMLPDSMSTMVRPDRRS